MQGSCRVPATNPSSEGVVWSNTSVMKVCNDMVPLLDAFGFAGAYATTVILLPFPQGAGAIASNELDESV
jgi:hypothetical protein